MPTFRLLATSLSLSAHLLAQSAPSRLEGCPDPARLALALKALQNQKWVNHSIESIEKIWPTSLRGGGSCEPHCLFLVDDGRVISNEIECGESIHFETSQSTGGSLHTRLESVVIKYSTRTRKDREAAERILIRGLYMGGDAKEDNFDRVRDFTWTDYEPERRLCGLHLQYARVNNKWLLIFHLSCGPGWAPPGVN
jgi:hypothetical protein